MPKIKLSFGFELEGNFDNDFAQKFIGRGDFKYDGSVETRPPKGFNAYYFEDEDSECGQCEGSGHYYEQCECETSCEEDNDHFHTENCLPCKGFTEYHEQECEDCNGTGRYNDDDGGGLALEYASEVYDSFASVKRDLAKFTEPNYIMDNSCGFHFHIGTRNNIKNRNALRAVLCNMDFMRKLVKVAQKEMCKCQRDRIGTGDNHWCKVWEGRERLIREYHNSSKYWFMNFHYSGTLEFRFLAPCEHKVENVTLLVKLVSDYLNSKDEIEINGYEPRAHEHIKVGARVDTAREINHVRHFQIEPDINLEQEQNYIYENLPLPAIPNYWQVRAIIMGQPIEIINDELIMPEQLYNELSGVVSFASFGWLPDRIESLNGSRVVCYDPYPRMHRRVDEPRARNEWELIYNDPNLII